MPRNSDLYLDDILEAIGRIRKYTLSMNYQSFVQDRRTQDAVIRNLEIIGEAAGRLPKSIKASASGIEWRKIAGLRNIFAHEYFGVSLPVIWDVIQNKSASLEIPCTKLLSSPIER